MSHLVPTHLQRHVIISQVKRTSYLVIGYLTVLAQVPLSASDEDFPVPSRVKYQIFPNTGNVFVFEGRYLWLRTSYFILPLSCAATHAWRTNGGPTNASVWRWEWKQRNGRDARQETTRDDFNFYRSTRAVAQTCSDGWSVLVVDASCEVGRPDFYLSNSDLIKYMDEIDRQIDRQTCIDTIILPYLGFIFPLEIIPAFSQHKR